MTLLLALSGCAWIGGGRHDADLAVWAVEFAELSIACGADRLVVEATTASEDGETVELLVSAGGASGTSEASVAAGRLSWTFDGLALDPTVTEVTIHLEGVGSERDETLSLVWTGQQTFYPDADADGFGAEVGIEACNAPAGHLTNGQDCDDTDPDVNPAADEVCGGGDEDCSGAVDDDPIDAVAGFVDADGDGAAGTPATACDAVAESTDCDDSDAAISPSATEVCGGVDENCDGRIDDEDPELDAPLAFVDVDGDGHTTEQQVPACIAADPGLPHDDCDDGNAEVNPDEPEVCDGLDNDCDTLVDDGDTIDSWGPDDFWYTDNDGDGFGVIDGLEDRFCVGPAGTVDNPDDCNDADAAVGGPDVYYLDSDQDGVISAFPSEACEVPDGNYQLTPGEDCNDFDSTINPLVEELCNNRDDDCDTDVDEEPAPYGLDNDGDGYTFEAFTLINGCPTDFHGYTHAFGDCNDNDPHRSPGVSEACNGIDDDCDLVVDDGAPAGFYDVVDETFSDQFPGNEPTGNTVYRVCGEVDWGGTLGRSITFQAAEDAVMTGRLEVDGFTLSIDGGSVQPSTTSVTHGGAFYVHDEGGLDLRGVTVTCPSGASADRGGAIAADGSVFATVTVRDTTFIGCQANLEGGAIWANEVLLNLHAVHFEGNRAPAGGAIFLQGNQGIGFNTTTNSVVSTFVDNVATGNGGAIHLAGPNTDVTRVVNTVELSFIGNQATEGGAIYAMPYGTLPPAAYQDNVASGRGGALHLVNGIQSLEGTFDDNSAEVSGGAVYIGNAAFETPTLASFDGNQVGQDCVPTVPHTCTGPGGAIHALGPLELLGGTTFIANAALEGGAVASQAALTVDGHLHRVRFEGNTAEQGNAIHFDDVTDVTSADFVGPGAAAAYFYLAHPGTLACVDCDTNPDDAVEFEDGALSGAFLTNLTYSCDSTGCD